MAGGHGATYFGKAKLSPCRVPVLGRTPMAPGTAPLGHRSPGTRCFASLRISTADPGADFGEEGEDPAGARAACSGDVCRAPGWVLLHGDLTAFLLGLCDSTFFLPCAKSAAPSPARTQRGCGSPRELPSAAQLPSRPNCGAIPAGPLWSPGRLDW